MANEYYIRYIANLIECARKDGVKCPNLTSPIIAQAIVESGWGESSLAKTYHNHFGMKCGSTWKGNSVNLQTNEEYIPGQITTIKDNFRLYATDYDGIVGYMDFIKYDRYKNLWLCYDAHEYVGNLRSDGWATSSSYVKTLQSVLDTYNLYIYDAPYAQEPFVPSKTDYYPMCTYAGVSIVDGLKSVGVTNAKDMLRTIASANNIPGYTGTAAQNTKMLWMLKNGKLIKPQ